MEAAVGVTMVRGMRTVTTRVITDCQRGHLTATLLTEARKAYVMAAGPAEPIVSTRVWAIERLHEPLTLTDLAAHTSTSIRTLTRRFHAETSLSPLQWLLHQRLDRARELLEATDLPADQVARQRGLGTADSLRSHMLRRVGLTPSAYRTSFTRTSR